MREAKYLLILITLLWSCANPVSPPGGTKDLEPPEVLVAVPRSGSTNYKGDHIDLLLNEYVSFQGGSQNVLITPEMPEKPKFVLKGKKLVIKLPENLDPNVTYSISLVNAIKDYTEGNTLNIYKYVFTQSTEIDSASISGVVVNSFDNQNVANVFVGLFDPSDTSAFIDSKPIYVSPTNDQGQFKVDYVKEGDYILRALEDKNFNFTLEESNERVSLSTNPIFVSKNKVLEQELPVFYNKQKPQLEGYKVLSNNSLYVFFNQEIEELALDVAQYSDQDIVYFNRDNDTLFYHWSDPNLEQLDFVFKLNETTVDSLNLPLLNKPKTKALAIRNSAESANPIVIQAGEYIESYNTDMILILDSVNQAIEYSIESKKQKLLLTIERKYIGTLKLQIKEGAILYSNGLRNDEELLKNIEHGEEVEQSTLSLTFAREITEATILELYNSNKKRIHTNKLEGLNKLDLKNLPAGTYTIRVFQDENSNGKWDTGNIYTKQEAEACLMYKKNVEIKENWDKELRLNF